ncbi:hypothetical protein BGZ65_004787 [Modicella reniformis]|uniref:Carrier domain-containing protein n=1 Tax=Modicella reniformis TaxID=1440133 RepID=A0A9P6IYJ9_9FUNG|nr:hypothetical protein BGZ65_004787 [Modicella reniformis]
MSHSPLFQNNEEVEWHLPAIETVEVGSSYDIAKFDLTLQLYESDEEIAGSLGYSTVLFDRSTVERHVGYLCKMLESMTTDADRVITTTEMIAPTERDLLLQTWNETKQDYPSNLCIHQLFEQQFERAPHATALVFMDQSMTYVELNTRANQLAHHLIELGVRPDMLATLKAGGAYIPTYASERLQDILNDATPDVVIADSRDRRFLKQPSAPLHGNLQKTLIPVGRPIANKRVYILDHNARPVPVSVAGELYIGGVGIARGYLNQPELSAKAFLLDPFVTDADARMYKTGDLARYLPDGNILFLGRNDHLVKIRGFRIELGEIEAHLTDHPLVEKAVVLSMGKGNSKRLVAYVVVVVAEANDQLTSTLHTYLSIKLPSYMVPSTIPLTPNGKLDRRQLPQPDSSVLVQEETYEAAQGEIETALLTIWMDLLNIDRIGRHDNFFMLGGHSLRNDLPHSIVIRLQYQPRSIVRGTNDRRVGTTNSGSSGLSWSYVGLSKYMHPDQPIFGLHFRGFFDDDQPAASLEDMAIDYIDQIRRIQPYGPYYLLGYSLGGMIAHTIAAHLELFAMMDAIPCVDKQALAGKRPDEEEEEEEEDDDTNFIHFFSQTVPRIMFPT